MLNLLESIQNHSGPLPPSWGPERAAARNRGTWGSHGAVPVTPVACPSMV